MTWLTIRVITHIEQIRDEEKEYLHGVLETINVILRKGAMNDVETRFLWRKFVG